MKKGSTLFTSIILISMIFLVYGCKKATAPTVTTNRNNNQLRHFRRSNHYLQMVVAI